MDTKLLMTQMMISISEVMETMFYIPVEPQEIETLQDCSFLDAEEITACRITFSGSFAGKIYFLIPKALLVIMTGNFMGESPENLTEEHLSGTIEEALNMVAGNTFSKIDPTASFGLGVPETNEKFIDEICTGEPSSVGKKNPDNTILIDTMDGPMAVSFQLDAPHNGVKQ